MADKARAWQVVKHYSGGAVGAGLVLVVLPSAALFFGASALSTTPTVGLPLVAIFGIMILFGALALTATLFARLHLDDSSQALALPEGSIRAAIALSLIVLFAIIAILLNQVIAKPYVISDLNEEQKAAMLRDFPQRVLAIIPTCLATPPASGSAEGDGKPAAVDCKGASAPYTVHMLPPPTPESTDLAKQLLILIGTLMTSVVSFYFGSRAAESKLESTSSKGTPASPAIAQDSDGDHGNVQNPTLDHELPASRGGVAT